MKLLLGFALLMGVTAAVAPATAKADAPVRVTACEPSSNLMDFNSVRFSPEGWTWSMVGDDGGRLASTGPYYTSMSGGFVPYEALRMPASPIVAVDYVNQTARPIRSVEFGLVTRGSVIAEVRDTGMFTTDVEIRHQFLVPGGWIGSGRFTCLPLMVTFSDGTIWNSPNPH